MSQFKTPLVVKVGGAILADDPALLALLEVLIQLKAAGQPVVLVHGGGASVDDLLATAGFSSEKKQGLRVTPKAQIPVIAGTLAGFVNKHLVALANSLGGNAIGLSLADGNLCQCRLSSQGLGMVGEPQANDPTFLTLMLANHFLPVVSSIGALADGQLVNVNADDAAVVVAQLLDGELYFLTDVPGVKGAGGELLAELSAPEIATLVDEGVIAGGMVAKVNAALQAAEKLRRSIAVASWQSPHYLLSLLVADSGSDEGFVGTRILSQ